MHFVDRHPARTSDVGPTLAPQGGAESFSAMSQIDNVQGITPYTLNDSGTDATNLTITNSGTWVNVMSANNSTTAKDIGVGIAYDTTLYYGQPGPWLLRRCDDGRRRSGAES